MERNESDVPASERHLAALTAGNRDDWARTREQYFSTGVNKISLDIIEKSAFFLALDTAEQSYDTVGPVAYSVLFVQRMCSFTARSL